MGFVFMILGLGLLGMIGEVYIGVFGLCIFELYILVLLDILFIGLVFF